VEVKDLTQGVNVYPVVDSLILEKDNSKNQWQNGQQVDRWLLMEEEYKMSTLFIMYKYKKWR
jgi:hypothetical protein